MGSFKKACTQYNDFTGTVAVDVLDGAINLGEYLSKNGFDSENYFAYNVQISAAEPIGKRDKRRFYVIITSVKKDEVGGSFKELKHYAETHSNDVPVYKFTFTVGIDEFFDIFKRIEISMDLNSKSGIDYSDTINETIIEDEFLEED